MQIKTYATPAVLRDSIFVDVWLHDVVEALHKTENISNTKVCLLSYLHPIIAFKVTVCLYEGSL